MTLKTTKKKSGKSYINYICTSHKRYGTCKNNNVSGIKLENSALAAIQSHIENYISVDDVTKSAERDELKNRKKTIIADMIKKSLHSVQEYNDYLVKSCAHMMDGIITQSEYEIFREDFRRKIADAETQIAHLQTKLEQNISGNDEFLEQFKAYGNITELIPISN